MTAEKDLVRAIREAGRIPVQRNTFYEPVKVWDEPAVAVADIPSIASGGDASPQRHQETAAAEA